MGTLVGVRVAYRVKQSTVYNSGEDPDPDDGGSNFDFELDGYSTWKRVISYSSSVTKNFLIKSICI